MKMAVLIKKMVWFDVTSDSGYDDHDFTSVLKMTVLIMKTV